jgi:hypothetical protein
MDVQQNPRRIVFFLLAVPMLLLASVASSQELVYQIDSAASTIHQTGGWGQSRYLTASGTFEVIIEGDQISFRRIDVEFAPTDYAPMVFPGYPGTLTGSTFVGDEHPCLAYSPSWYAGSFVDDRIVFDGFYEMCAADGDEFTYSIEAVRQQQPAIPQLNTWGVALFSAAVLAVGMWIVRRKP